MKYRTHAPGQIPPRKNELIAYIKLYSKAKVSDLQLKSTKELKKMIKDLRAEAMNKFMSNHKEASLSKTQPTVTDMTENGGKYAN